MSTSSDTIPKKCLKVCKESIPELKQLRGSGFTISKSNYRQSKIMYQGVDGLEEIYTIWPKKKLQWALEPKSFVSTVTVASSNIKGKNGKAAPPPPAPKKKKDDAKITAAICVYTEKVEAEYDINNFSTYPEAGLNQEQQEAYYTKLGEEEGKEEDVKEKQTGENENENDTDEQQTIENGKSEDENESENDNSSITIDFRLDQVEFCNQFDKHVIQNIVYKERTKWGIGPTVVLDAAQENFKGTLSSSTNVNADGESIMFKSYRAEVPFIGTVAEDNVKYGVTVWDGHSYDEKTKMFTKKMDIYPIPAETYVTMHCSPKLYKLQGNPIGIKWTVVQMAVYLDKPLLTHCLPCEDVPTPIPQSVATNQSNGNNTAVAIQKKRRLENEQSNSGSGSSIPASAPMFKKRK